ncbi:hypothetical protein SYNPS1DRAFT_29884 [Syncephalis pseudoplumigaleata]|uniref:Uncharacterized protein n=1 Tax=Syncephalis pseudoplumigaleata TaxID=1712513 RepID=A0A4P9YWF3_9FUNG|nr:hypothetical protein SYNPS1DRAFT_29884 [Syncephalis pseudoplumigaleata]|eukprot:RKP24347.1 hypothetical protein SYNPS1DRAFT_29884 [Syncephalis pseudoplumigaleata]
MSEVTANEAATPPLWNEVDAVVNVDTRAGAHPAYCALRSPVRQHALLLGRFTELELDDDTDDNILLLRAEQRYLHWLAYLHKRRPETMPVPPLDVAMMWCTHMLSPLRYMEDMIRLFGEHMLDYSIPFEQLTDKEADGTFRVDSRSQLEWEQITGLAYTLDPACKSPFSMTCLSSYAHTLRAIRLPSVPCVALARHDLGEAVPGCGGCLRQEPFPAAPAHEGGAPDELSQLSDADAPAHPAPHPSRLSRQPDVLHKAVDRYGKFLALMAVEKKAFLVPTLDIDLAWHTHQMHPKRYQTYTLKLVGRIVNHDDTVTNKRLDASYLTTADSWYKQFQGSYRCATRRMHRL